jgi:hypothetical protein
MVVVPSMAAGVLVARKVLRYGAVGADVLAVPEPDLHAFHCCQLRGRRARCHHPADPGVQAAKARTVVLAREFTRDSLVGLVVTRQPPHLHSEAHADTSRVASSRPPGGDRAMTAARGADALRRAPTVD